MRFYQPSSSSVTLNRVTGYDPSYILGQMSSNGKIFLVNPYGVVFGAGARVDVGGLVVSTLSIANNDFLAGRYSLTSVDPDAPAQRGAVRNDGTISAPGGTVVLAGPSVTNTGTIVANGGRVGLVAANAVSVDVEGDGLLFFQTSATEAKNRLEQLGRIQADGGTVEMRAAARGAFADTVLNMAGIVQAKTVGSREGKIVIDGGGEGIVAVSGRIDATGLAAGQRGGSVTVEGQRVLLDNGSMVDASGSAGGGSIRIGGDFHGANPGLRNAEVTGVAAGAVVRADAIDAGDGGKVAIWADGTTRFYGSVSAEGGQGGGDGGFVEVSGKQNLVFRGDVSTLAPKGKTGTLLLDPADIVIAAAVASARRCPTRRGRADRRRSGRRDPGRRRAGRHRDDQHDQARGDRGREQHQPERDQLDHDQRAGIRRHHAQHPDAEYRRRLGAVPLGRGRLLDAARRHDHGDERLAPDRLGRRRGQRRRAAGERRRQPERRCAVTLNAPISVTAAGAGVSIVGATTLAGAGGTITLTGSNAANDVALGTVNGAGRVLNVTAGGGDIVVGAIGGGAPLANVTLSGNTASLAAAVRPPAHKTTGRRPRHHARRHAHRQHRRRRRSAGALAAGGGRSP